MRGKRWLVRAGAVGLAVLTLADPFGSRRAASRDRVYTLAALSAALGHIRPGQSVLITGRMVQPATVLPSQVYSVHSLQGNASLDVVPAPEPGLLAALRHVPILASVLQPFAERPLLDRVAVYRIAYIGCTGPSLCPGTWQLEDSGVPAPIIHPLRIARVAPHDPDHDPA